MSYLSVVTYLSVVSYLSVVCHISCGVTGEEGDGERVAGDTGHRRRGHE